MPVPASEDDLKRRARRRLVGAVALTLAAVIVLPLLLEDEPPPAGRLDVHMPPVKPVTKQVDEAPVLAVLPPVKATPALPVPEIALPVQADPKVLVVPKQKPSPGPNGPAKSGSKPAFSSAAATSAFVVQLGAFTDTTKVAALKSRSVKLGFPTYTDKSGALTRLRVGPFASREAAMEAAGKLVEAGMNGQVMPQ